MSLSATTNPTSFSVAGQLITYMAEVRNVGTGPLIGRLEVYDTGAGSTSHPMPILQAMAQPFAQPMGYPGYPGYGQNYGQGSGHGCQSGCGQSSCNGGCNNGCMNSGCNQSSSCQNQGPRPGEVFIPPGGAQMYQLTRYVTPADITAGQMTSSMVAYLRLNDGCLIVYSPTILVVVPRAPVV